MFEFNAKVSAIGYFIVGEGNLGNLKYGEMFIPLSVEDTALEVFEDMGYEIATAYTPNAVKEYTS